MYIEFAEYAGEVRLDGLLADKEHTRDLTVGQRARTAA
jgi:hypothetical protein